MYLWLIHADAWQKESQYCKVPKVAPALTMTEQSNTSRKVNNYCDSLIYYILIVMPIKSSLLFSTCQCCFLFSLVFLFLKM